MARYSICHTTARRDGWEASFRSWVSWADSTGSFEYILCIDRRWGFTDGDEEFATATFKRMGVTGKVVWNDGRKCMVDGYAAAVRASSGDIIILNSDDMRACKSWDFYLDAAIHGRPAFDDFVVQVSSDTPADQRNLMVLQIMSRGRYDRLGYALYQAYESMCADDDFSEHARQDGVVIDARDLIFPHLHFTVGKSVQDGVYEWQNRNESYFLGWKLLEARRKAGFSELTAEVVRYVQSNTGPPSLTVCLPGEVFGQAYLAAWTNLLPHLMAKFNLRVIYGYQSDVYAMRNWMTSRILENPSDWVLWIDDDNIVSPAVFDELYAVANADDAPDVVAGWCWIFDEARNEYIVSCGHRRGLSTLRPSDPRLFTGQVIPVDYTGFPVVLHRASMLHNGIFDPMQGVPGEDVAFCKRINDKNGDIAVATKAWVPHLKTVSVQPTVDLATMKETEQVPAQQ